MDDETTIQSANRKSSGVTGISIAVLQGPDAGKTFYRPGETSVSIGKSPDNDLPLTDPTVSRYHLELCPTENGIRLADLGSLNGTFIGNFRVDAATLPSGTRLRLGSTMLAVEDPPAAGSEEEEEAPSIAGLVGESPAMNRVAQAIHRLAPTNVSVLVQGETGTGKEKVAEAIHQLSSRSDKRLEVIDCGSLPKTLIASQLFGHERGAFTGADRRHIGAFERADGGTVFLDEIGELPLSLQPTLLGVLERRRFRRLGGTNDIKVDVRVVAATNRDLRAEANQGSFRADLYFRLAVARIVVPPLRERAGDIPLLVEHFCRESLGEAGVGPFDESAMEELSRHFWSGNVRELRNVVESAIAMGHVQLESTPPPSTAAGPRSTSAPASGPIAPPRPRPKANSNTIEPYRQARAGAIGSFERTYLKHLIDTCNGNASEAARRAKMDRPYLLTLLRKHHLR